ncbi:hypothetical protein CBL_11866 [Carabus blaptoides fortunei]
MYTESTESLGPGFTSFLQILLPHYALGPYSRLSATVPLAPLECNTHPCHPCRVDQHVVRFLLRVTHEVRSILSDFLVAFLGLCPTLDDGCGLPRGNRSKTTQEITFSLNYFVWKPEWLIDL